MLNAVTMNPAYASYKVRFGNGNTERELLTEIAKSLQATNIPVQKFQKGDVGLSRGEVNLAGQNIRIIWIISPDGKMGVDIQPIQYKDKSYVISYSASESDIVGDVTVVPIGPAYQDVQVRLEKPRDQDIIQGLVNLANAGRQAG